MGAARGGRPRSYATTIRGERFAFADDEPLLEVLAALRQERERQGLSLTDVMERTWMDRATIDKLENGKIPNPTYTTMRAYAKALGLRLAWKVELLPAEIEVKP